MPFTTQTLEEFYRSSLSGPKQTGPEHHFNVADIAERLRGGELYPTYIRRDFYKIMLFRGDAQFHFGDETIAISGDSLLFFNPRVPYTYESLQQDARGYFCVFKEDFFKEDLRINLDDVPLFLPGVKPVFSLDPGQCEEIGQLFKKMQAELDSNYAYKYQLIRAYVIEIIYFAMKLAPLTYRPADTNASARITAVFLELLDRQFPVELSGDRLLLRTPKDFADKLAIHINYLNRAVKAQTGKTTSEHIFERLAAEAKAMLRHTGMNIAEIGYSLGFQDQAHFNNFFRKRVHMSPSSFRLANTTSVAATGPAAPLV